MFGTRGCQFVVCRGFPRHYVSHPSLQLHVDQHFGCHSKRHLGSHICFQGQLELHFSITKSVAGEYGGWNPPIGGSLHAVVQCTKSESVTKYDRHDIRGVTQSCGATRLFVNIMCCLEDT